MVYACPISTRRVDSHLVRVMASQISLLTILFLWTGESFLVGILFFDFTMRVCRQQRYSPLFILAKYFLSTFKIAAKPCDEAPKRFALYLGWIIAIVLLTTSLLHLEMTSLYITVILLLCALLEALFDYCIGCKLYYVIQLLKRKEA